MPSVEHPLIDAASLRAALSDPDLRVVDCRFSLQDKESGAHEYARGHIPGAVYLNLETDLSGPVGPRGGRHPLPDPDRLAARLGSLGIGADSWVVAYDTLHSEFAARLWWLLRYLGHDRVQILDGGLQSWLDLGAPLTADIPRLAPQVFPVHLRTAMLVDDHGQVEAAARDRMLVDSRAPERYRGDVEPLDRRAGHIPGAVNREWLRIQDARGHFRPRETLKARFADLRGRDPVVYCGSGVTACVNLVAMTIAGLEPRLYAGSWSDWISDPSRPVALGPEHPDPGAD